ncbi:MAG: hypothetical protein ACFB6S_11795 [Geminicoccaceae bacterium]
MSLFIVAGGLAGERSVAADISCTCLFQGTSYELGAVVCVNSPEGMRLARCEKVQNVSSWTFSDQLCPVVRQETRPHPISKRKRS